MQLVQTRSAQLLAIQTVLMRTHARSVSAHVLKRIELEELQALCADANVASGVRANLHAVG